MLHNHALHYTQLIKQISKNLGFDYCGIAKAEKLTDDARRLENWLHKGFQGSMHYMNNYFDERIDPTVLVPNAQSVITLLINHFPAAQQRPDSPKVAKYAYGKDYHDVVKQKLNQFLYLIKQSIGNVEGRGFIDSAPILERAWAVKAGLGWVGKNGNLITRKTGSFFFIASLIVDLTLLYDAPFVSDFCGSCTRCIDTCPTHAILPNKTINASQCISYFTIELKDALIPSALKGQFDNWMFGCDACQDVCPWNRFSKPTAEVGFTPIPAVLNLSTAEWYDMSEQTFAKFFKQTALKRAKYKGIQRNLSFLKMRP